MKRVATKRDPLAIGCAALLASALLLLRHRSPSPGSATARTVQPPEGRDGDAARFGLEQSVTLANALEHNAAKADAYVDKLCEQSRKLRENRPPPGPPGTHDDAAGF